MEYSESSIDPDVLEFYRPAHYRNQQHHLHHVHHQQHQPPHAHYQHQHPGQQQQQYRHQCQQSHAAPYHTQQHTGSRPPQAQCAHHPNTSAGGKPCYQQSTSTGGSSTTSSAGGSGPTNSLRAIDLLTLLRERIALLPGGRDRRGGPILCFPANSRADQIPIEELYLLVRYLTYLPEESVKKLGFTVIIDMRSGTTWHSVKPILKVLQECIGGSVEVAYIIKPDKFLEKQKAQMAAGKFTFEIHLVSVENLYRDVDPSQLTSDLEGSLPYNNEEWIQLRCSLEEFFLLAHDMTAKFEQLYRFLDRKENPETVEEAKRLLEEHRSVRLKVVQAPVPMLEAEADRLGQWLRYGIAAANAAAAMHSATGAAYLGNSWVSMNPDFQQLAPQVKQTVGQLYEFRSHLQQRWEGGRARLEQIFQLRLFEEDAGRMAAWLDQQRSLFLAEYLDIGQTASQAADLHAEHRHFLTNCANVREQVARLNGVAGMLADTGHFASQQIIKQAHQLEHEWKSFTAALDDRSRVLQLSASFHARAEAFLANCPHWDSAMRQVAGNTVTELNQAIINLQELWQEAQSAHEEVCSDGRALANHLSSPVPTGSHTSLTAAVDYSAGRKHCTDLVHDLWAWFKQLELVHNERKKRLTSRLALLMFKEDVGQVLAWLTEHGEPFLDRQTTVGKSIQRAEQLYNAHMQFEQVAANTLTNADKLISAADDLSAQAEDPEEILQEATELQRRINAFTSAVEERRETLDLACGFYSHTKELFTWFHQLREGHDPGEHLPASIEGMEEELTHFHRDRAAVEEAGERVVNEGDALIHRLRDQDEVQHLRTVLAQVLAERSAANDLFSERQVRLDLCLQLRLFEADVHSGLDCLRHEVPQPATCPFVTDQRTAPDIQSLEEASAACLTALHTADEVLTKGAELARAFDSVGVNFPAGGPGSSDSGVGDSIESAVERIQRLMTELAEAVTGVDELNERLAGELDWRRLEQKSQQVLHWIGRCEEILHKTAVVPSSLAEAEHLYSEHDKFQPILNDAHPEAVQCIARAECMIQQGGPQHPRRNDFLATAEAVANRWQRLVSSAEEKHKLLMTGSSWYKTSEQVTSVLRSLEKEYRREEDWCQSEKALASGDQGGYISHLLAKHNEQKEAFVKACILARRTSDVFVKYINRQPLGTANKASVEAKMRTAMSELMRKEQAVLEAWALRRRRLDDCANFINLKTDAELLLTRPTVPSSADRKLEEEARRICAVVDNLGDPMHAALLRSIVDQLRSRFPPPELHQEEEAQNRQQHQGAKSGQQQTQLKLKPPVSTSDSSNRCSVSSTGSAGSTGSSTSTVLGTGVSSTVAGSTATINSTPSSSSNEAGLTQEQRKVARRRENLLRELVQTEATYVNDLKQCLDTYLAAMTRPPAPEIQIPSGLLGRESTIFCNMLSIAQFHGETFLRELVKYTEGGGFLPEDVGHCFVSHSDRLAALYVEYCVNKGDSAQLLIDEGQGFFQDVQKWHNVGESLQSYLIKPVQRITKYQLLLKELFECCDRGSAGELGEGLEAMLAVPKKANDALHLSMLQGLPEEMSPLSSLGEVILQEQFTVWEPKQLIKKGRERRVFLFDVGLILAKELPSLPGERKLRYQFKSRHLLAECNITEHIEGDQCKFALWTGRVPPIHDYRLVLRAPSLDVKQTWVRAMRECIQELMFTVQSFCTPSGAAAQQQAGDKTGDTDSVETSFYVVEDYRAAGEGQLTVSTNQRVELLDQTGDWALVRANGSEGHIPFSLLVARKRGSGPPQHQSRIRRGSAASGNNPVKKWLPAAIMKERASKAGSAPTAAPATAIPAPAPANKRGSRQDVPPAQGAAVTPSPSSAATAAVESLLDNVSEESVEVELPPPMELQAFPVVAGATAVVSSGSGPGEMEQACGASVCTTTTATNSTIDEEEMNGDGDGDDPVHHPIMTVSEGEVVCGAGILQRMQQQQGQGETGMLSVEPNGSSSLRSSRHHSRSPQAAARYSLSASPPSHPPLGAGAGEEAGNTADATPATNEEGDSTLPTSSPLKLLGFPGNDLSALGELRLQGNLRVASRLSATDQSGGAGVTEETSLRFLPRRLLLFDKALIIGDPVVGMQPGACQYKHAIPIVQMKIMEDVDLAGQTPGSRPPSHQLLWFALTEHPVMPGPGSGMVLLTHVIDPASPDTRARWLTELAAMVREARRMTGSAGAGGSGTGSGVPPPSIFGPVCPSEARPSRIPTWQQQQQQQSQQAGKKSSGAKRKDADHTSSSRKKESSKSQNSSRHGQQASGSGPVQGQAASAGAGAGGSRKKSLRSLFHPDSSHQSNSGLSNR